MTSRTATEAARYGKLAERMVPNAIALACAVRDEGPESIGEFLAGFGAREKDALLVVLAAMVPVDQSPQALLSWISWDEHGRPLPEDCEMVLHAGRPYVREAKSQCPSVGAFLRHQKAGEDGTACGCRAVYNAYQRDRRANLRVPPDRAELAAAGIPAQGSGTDRPDAAEAISGPSREDSDAAA